VELQQHVAEVERRYEEPLARLSEAMRVAQQLNEVADQLIGHFVDHARQLGASWTEIGQSMGVTKQAAQKRFVPRPARVPQWISDQTVEVIQRAQEEAREAGHGYIDVVHMVLAVLHNHPDVAGGGARTGAVRAAITATLPPGKGRVPEHIPFTPEAKKALEAGRVAKGLGRRQVEPAHLLLGVLGDNRFSFLKDFGVTESAVKAWAARAAGTRA
jgi:hypothetical protein